MAVNTVESGILGVQMSLVGLLLVVFFEGVYPYPLVGFLFGLAGTVVVLTGIFSETLE
ncbi:hypothetical protein [Haloarcula brevis]|uniref:hypothetical protein n=1 Tax=Haloarcula brevis TaxID=3111453 RepID=UPI00300E9E7F